LRSGPRGRKGALLRRHFAGCTRIRETQTRVWAVCRIQRPSARVESNPDRCGCVGARSRATRAVRATPPCRPRRMWRAAPPVAPASASPRTSAPPVRVATTRSGKQHPAIDDVGVELRWPGSRRCLRRRWRSSGRPPPRGSSCWHQRPTPARSRSRIRELMLAIA
jgi:hypothetical protein